MDGYSSNNFTVTAEEMAMITKLNQLDIKLYERAKEIFEARWRDMIGQTPETLRGERFVSSTRMAPVKFGKIRLNGWKEQRYYVLTTEDGSSSSSSSRMQEKMLGKAYIGSCGDIGSQPIGLSDLAIVFVVSLPWCA